MGQNEKISSAIGYHCTDSGIYCSKLRDTIYDDKNTECTIISYHRISGQSGCQFYPGVLYALFLEA